ncbi:MAG: hypothetical protein U0736_17295 [Gemmataceae bacterium]
MPTLSQVVIHGDATDKHQYRYQFTPKHHGADPDAAQWIPALALDDEFSVFNTADEHDLVDEEGRLYGVLPERDTLRDLGTWAQQVAEFPAARDGEAWHGYPIWAVSGLAPPNRRGERMRPGKAVFDRLRDVGLITERMRKRLYKGDHV